MLKPDLLKATAFHEAGHAVGALALEHLVESIRIDLRPVAAEHGITQWITQSDKGSSCFFEECATVYALGGLAETKHDSAWEPEATYRDRDLDWIRQELKAMGEGDEVVEQFLAQCDQASNRLLDDAALWMGIAGLASWLLASFPERYEEWEFMGTAIKREVESATSKTDLDHCASEIRKYARELKALRTTSRSADS